MNLVFFFLPILPFALRYLGPALRQPAISAFCN